MGNMIGIIGGNGVAATNRLCQLIEEKRTNNGGYRDAHHPEMIIWQATQAPSRSLFLEGKGDSFVDDYITIGKKLKSNGCSHLAMCCNTAHFCVKELEEKIGLPFINIIIETLKQVNPQNNKVGVICSDGAKRYDLYGKYLKYLNNSNIELIYPNFDFQQKVTQGICNAKNKKRNITESSDQHPQKLFMQVYEHLVKQGCTSIILGCTDISAVFTPPQLYVCR